MISYTLDQYAAPHLKTTSLTCLRCGETVSDDPDEPYYALEIYGRAVTFRAQTLDTYRHYVGPFHPLCTLGFESFALVTRDGDPA